HHLLETRFPSLTGNFEEVLLGLTGEEALDEAGRCLRCDIRVCQE
ncbi:MAG TPA: hypothetical protein DEH78_00480, partial [Solibacterales bacterium]|nr:hypothetical protein [Bryobacterales bacterium]